jgi:hypothetical protein
MPPTKSFLGGSAELSEKVLQQVELRERKFETVFLVYDTT